MTLHRLTFTLLIGSVLLAGCNHPAIPNPPAVDSGLKKDAVHGNFSDQTVLRVDTGSLRSFFQQFPGLKMYQDEVTAFYGYRKDRYAWYDSAGLVEQASNLYNHLNNLPEEGIIANIPYKPFLDSLLNDPVSSAKADTVAEIFLSAEYFFYADKVWKGLADTATTRLQWMIPRKKLDLPYLADSLLRDSARTLFSGTYNFVQYERLKRQLARYRKLDSLHLPEIGNAGPANYKKSDSAQLIAQIRHRLYVYGDLGDDSGSPIVDDSLVSGVRSFQRRYGMNPDGQVGPAFLKEIRVPVADNIRKLLVNMERTRWMPANLHGDYLIINIPAFTLIAYDSDTVEFAMNVVVGKDVHQTVIFSGDIKFVVFSPYWNVPASIMKKEVLPAIKKNPGYLQRNNMEWSGNSVRQKPGPANSLGLVKFLFPNSYDIYLHDSPAKSLFGSESRAFSHGCIRLAEPRKLAVYLLKDDPNWPPAKIDQAMHAGKERYVTLKNPIPVYIGYMTAWVDNQGQLNFRKDIYHRDETLEKMILQ